MGFLVLAVFLKRHFDLMIYKSRKEMIFLVSTMFLIGIAWDYYATSRKHWVFPGNGLLGIRIYGLPIEEFLFMLILPYFIITVYKVYEMKAK